MRKIWEIENTSDSNWLFSNEEKKFENNYEDIHYKSSNGQYVESMPIEDATLLEESKNLAEKESINFGYD